MTDREQIRRSSQALVDIDERGENQREWPPDTPVSFARACLALLAELEQAERERDKYRGEWEQEIRAALIRCEAVEARLAKADALAEAAQSAERWLRDRQDPPRYAAEVLARALAAYEQEQKP